MSTATETVVDSIHRVMESDAPSERALAAVVMSKSMTRAEVIGVLQSSLYPGAKPESVEMVLAYCEAARLDPMQKPVHIVPMSVKAGQNAYGDDQYENRDVVMPGIGLYRTQAARAGQYAGLDEPEFGPTRTLSYRKKVTEWVPGQNGGKRQKKETWAEATLEYPEWCKVVVYRLVNGVRCPFPAVEFWTENYATAGRWTDAPNAMWERRPRGQLVKCCEAQALRKAFPEAVGAQPTAEEMEGREFRDLDDVRTVAGDVVHDDLMPKAKATESARPVDEGKGELFVEEGDAACDVPPPATGGKPISEAMLRILKKKAAANKIAEQSIAEQFGVQSLESLPMTAVNDAMRMAGGAK